MIVIIIIFYDDYYDCKLMVLILRLIWIVTVLC